MMIKHEFLVDGMSCPHCIQSVTKALMGVEGVSHVAVDLGTKNASVEMDERFATEDTLFRVVKEAGFTPQKKS